MFAQKLLAQESGKYSFIPHFLTRVAIIITFFVIACSLTEQLVTVIPLKYRFDKHKNQPHFQCQKCESMS